MEEEKDHVCPHCGSKNIDYVTRVTGYFSRVSMWNKGKIAELHDRDHKMNQKYFGSERIKGN